MRLTLLLNGAHWPECATDLDLLQSLNLPAWRLIKKKSVISSLKLTKSAALGQYFRWPILKQNAFFATPIALRLDGTSVTVYGLPEVTAPELEDLAAVFNAHFIDERLCFEVENGLLLGFSSNKTLPSGKSFMEIEGADFSLHLPKSSDDFFWTRIQSEIQMICYQWVGNKNRSLKIDSCWLWVPPKNESVLEKQKIILLEAPIVGNFDDFLAASKTHPQGEVPHWVVRQDTLNQALIYKDLNAWLAAWQNLEKDWFAPAVKALQNGELSELIIECPDRETGIRYQWLKFGLISILIKPFRVLGALVLGR
ncbi:MAG: hypothetical protein K2P98_01865 [Neisseriaceae bacterium]|nr:hypothetical protein [Neisseriaceae bacterium]